MHYLRSETVTPKPMPAREFLRFIRQCQARLEALRDLTEVGTE